MEKMEDVVFEFRCCQQFNPWLLSPVGTRRKWRTNRLFPYFSILESNNGVSHSYLEVERTGIVRGNDFRRRIIWLIRDRLSSSRKQYQKSHFKNPNLSVNRVHLPAKIWKKKFNWLHSPKFTGLWAMSPIKLIQMKFADSSAVAHPNDQPKLHNTILPFHHHRSIAKSNEANIPINYNNNNLVCLMLTSVRLWIRINFSLAVHTFERYMLTWAHRERWTQIITTQQTNFVSHSVIHRAQRICVVNDFNIQSVPVDNYGCSH